MNKVDSRQEQIGSVSRDGNPKERTKEKKMLEIKKNTKKIKMCLIV